MYMYLLHIELLSKYIHMCIYICVCVRMYRNLNIHICKHVDIKVHQDTRCNDIKIQRHAGIEVSRCNGIIT